MKKHLIVFLVAMAGTVVGNLLLTATPLRAAVEKESFGSVNIVNGIGQRVGTFANGDGNQGVLFLFSDSGKTTVQMGAYPSGGEMGQALIGLNDKANQLRMLFRLHSKDDSPTLIMKDRYGTDKIVLGLRGEKQTPYLEYKNDDGEVKDLLSD